MGCLLSTVTPHGDVLPLDLAPLQVQPQVLAAGHPLGRDPEKQYSLTSFHSTHLATGNSHSSLHLHIETGDWAQNHLSNYLKSEDYLMGNIY